MQLELLTKKPVSGTIPEQHFDVSAATNTWVRFGDDEGNDWVGVFGNADNAFFSAAVPFGDDGGRTALVIARGQGYIVDTLARRLLRKTDWDYSYSAVAPPGRDFIVVADTTDIWITKRFEDGSASSPNGWGAPEEPRRIALDGLILDEPTHDSLTGKAWFDDGWYSFRMNLATRLVTIGERVTTDEGAFQAVAGRGGFPTSHAYHDWMQQFWLQ